MSLLRDILAAHALRFERPDRAGADDASVPRLLAAFAIVGLLVQPGLRALARALGFADSHWAPAALVVTLLVAVLLALRLIVQRSGTAIGLHRWSAWTRRERLYFLTVVPIAVAAFGFVFRRHLAGLADLHGVAGLVLVVIPTGLLWGMVQEFLYRGLLQTSWTRSFGGVAGVLLANLVFTFGPLHFQYFGLGTDSGPRWAMFAAIFAIGLVFGTLYRRSGNLWIPAVLHGLWPLNMS